MKRALTTITLGSTLLLTACLNVGTKDSELENSPTGTVIPQKVETGTFRKKPQADVIGDTREMANVKKVAIPGMMIQFNKRAGQSAEATTGGPLGSGPSANLHIKAQLEGVDDATFQALADQTYKDLVAKLSDAGFQVTPTPELEKSETFRELSSDKYPDIDDKKARVMPKGLRDPDKSFLSKAIMTLPKIADETGTFVLYPSYIADFAAFGVDADDNRIDSLGNRTANVEISLGQVAHVWGSITSHDQRTQASLGQATYSTRPMGEFTETTSKALKGVQTTLNIFSSMQGGSTRTDKEKTLTTTPEKYKVAMLEALTEANTRLVGKLKAANKD